MEYHYFFIEDINIVDDEYTRIQFTYMKMDDYDLFLDFLKGVKHNKFYNVYKYTDTELERKIYKGYKIKITSVLHKDKNLYFFFNKGKFYYFNNDIDHIKRELYHFNPNNKLWSVDNEDLNTIKVLERKRKIKNILEKS